MLLCRNGVVSECCCVGMALCRNGVMTYVVFVNGEISGVEPLVGHWCVRSIYCGFAIDIVLLICNFKVVPFFLSCAIFTIFKLLSRRY